MDLNQNQESDEHEGQGHLNPRQNVMMRPYLSHEQNHDEIICSMPFLYTNYSCDSLPVQIRLPFPSEFPDLLDLSATVKSMFV